MSVHQLGAQGSADVDGIGPDACSGQSASTLTLGMTKLCKLQRSSLTVALCIDILTDVPLYGMPPSKMTCILLYNGVIGNARVRVAESSLPFWQPTEHSNLSSRTDDDQFVCLLLFLHSTLRVAPVVL